MRRVSVVSAVLAVSFAAVLAPLDAQTLGDAADPRFFHKRFYVYALAASHDGVPVSFERVPAGGGLVPEEEVESGSSGLAWGGGFSLEGLDRSFLFEIGFDRMSGSFTDWRVRDRRIGFNQIDFTFGWVLRRAVALAPYVSMGFGWYDQDDDYRDLSDPENFGLDPLSELGPGHYEAMEDLSYDLISGALGLKVGLLRHLALRGEVRMYAESSGGGGSCGTNCIVIDVSERADPQRLGFRTAVGLQLHTGLGLNR